MTDDFLVFSERLIIFRPLSGKRPIVQGLVRTVSVIKSSVRRDKMIEVFLTEDDEEVQALDAYRFYPSFDESVLVGRSRRRWLDAATNVLEHLIKFSDVHPITITDEILDPQISFADLLNERMSLANHPFAVRLKRAGRADHSASGKMNKHQNKRLPQASRGPDHLAEEIDWPERLDVGLEELVPGSTTSLGALAYAKPQGLASILI